MLGGASQYGYLLSVCVGLKLLKISSKCQCSLRCIHRCHCRFSGRFVYWLVIQKSFNVSTRKPFLSSNRPRLPFFYCIYHFCYVCILYRKKLLRMRAGKNGEFPFRSYKRTCCNLSLHFVWIITIILLSLNHQIISLI